jgi:hypothetical protein
VRCWGSHIVSKQVVVSLLSLSIGRALLLRNIIFLLLSKHQGLVRLEGWNRLKTFIHLIESRTSDLPLPTASPLISLSCGKKDDTILHEGTVTSLISIDYKAVAYILIQPVVAMVIKGEILRQDLKPVPATPSRQQQWESKWRHVNLYNHSCYCSLAVGCPHVFDTIVILNIINRLLYIIEMKFFL